MNKKEIIGGLLALNGAGLVMPFALLSGLTQLDRINWIFIPIMGLGLLLGLFGLYWMGRGEEDRS
ncbi:MAG: hypothetical protein OHK005_01670 [Candidatus Methylacidiphilales bacterium]